jgi:lipoprotein-anchoring transpeptidase ErfK/SrfK
MEDVDTMKIRIPLACAVTVVLLLAAPVVAASAAAPHDLRAQPAMQQLAMLKHDTGAFSAPNPLSHRVTELSDVRPITGERTVVPVLEDARGPRGMRWLKVLLPGRPDSHTGWIARRATTLSLTPWRLIVRLSTRQVTVLYDGRVSRIFLAVVGKPSTPTPTGSFFVEETVALDPDASGAPYALALSARSNVLHEFDGGPGQTALHGIENIGGVPGTAVSHGCVRLNTPAITWLATHIAPGVPVTIEP